MIICYATGMDTKDLEAVGLTQQQATVYLFLVKNGVTKPATVASQLKLSRTNAYKILDSLVELGLITKETTGKTLSYKPENPLALASLSARYRAEAVAREETVNSLMHTLLETYGKHTKKPGVEVYSGRDEVVTAFRKQISLKEDITFIHTKTDVPMIGFDIMHELRVAPTRNGNTRQAIMAAPDHKNINRAQHRRSSLQITWIDSGKYTAAVEWSVTDTSLLIVSYEIEPQAILIIDPLVATAFKQIWTILNTFLQTTDTHTALAN